MHALNIADGTERSFSPVLVTASVAGNRRGQLRRPGDVQSQAGKPATRADAGRRHCLCRLRRLCRHRPVSRLDHRLQRHEPGAADQLRFQHDAEQHTAAYGANAAEGGIWMGGGGLAVDDNTNLYFEVGNGTFNVTNNSGGHGIRRQLSSSFRRPTGWRSRIISRPTTRPRWQQNDTDLGSGGLLLLPDQPGTYPHLLLGAGKGREEFMSSTATSSRPTTIILTPTDSLITSRNPSAAKSAAPSTRPPISTARIYYAGNGDNLKAFSVTSGVLSGSAGFHRARAASISRARRRASPPTAPTTASSGRCKWARPPCWSPATPRISRPNFTTAPAAGQPRPARRRRQVRRADGGRRQSVCRQLQFRFRVRPARRHARLY